jgi:hypothetical protein
VNSFGPEKVDQSNTCSLHIGERLCKLEQLFDRFVCRKNSLANLSADVPHSPTLVNSSDRESSSGLPKSPSDEQSISSIGDGIVSLCIYHARHFINHHSLVHKIGRLRLPFAHYHTSLKTESTRIAIPSSGPWLLSCHHSTMQISSSSLPMDG